MVSHGLSIAALTCPAANVLFELFKSGFNFPASPIILNDLCYGKLQISGKHTYPLGFTEHPNHSNRAFEGLDHNHSIISAHFSVFAVKVDAISLGLLPRNALNNALKNARQLPRAQHENLPSTFLINNRAKFFD